MIITQSYLDAEIEFAKIIFLGYTDRMLEYLRVGSDRYQVWYRDSLQIYFLLKFLNNIYLTDGVPYIGDQELPLPSLRWIFSKIREYWRIDLDDLLEYTLGIETPTTTINIPEVPIDPPFQSAFVWDWKEHRIEITTDNPTVITLPFNINVAKPESMQLTVNGMSDPNNTSDLTKYGYHIVGNILYWHNFYKLLPGNVIVIQYLQDK
jgi:hypothetical protein